MELHFECTACGKCCTEAPEMTVLEATRLGDVFVPALVYRLTSLPRDDNEAALATLKPHPHFANMNARELVSQLRETTAVRAAGAIVSEAGWDHHVSITARAWLYPQTKRACPALAPDGKACTIHARRPHTCRTVPVRYDVPASLLVRAYRGTIDAGIASPDPWECDVSTRAPVLMRDDVLVNAEYVTARAAGEEAALAEHALAKRVLTSPLLPPLNEVYSQLRRSKLVAISFHGALAAAHELGMLDTAAVKAFCTAQLELLDSEIAKALSRKRKEDRDTTGRYRTLIAAYRAMLDHLQTS